MGPETRDMSHKRKNGALSRVEKIILKQLRELQF